MANGVAFISRWVIRMPVLEMAARAEPVRGSLAVERMMRNTRAARTNVRVAQVDETGGILLAASWDDGTYWEDPPSILAGKVKGRRTSAPITDAVVFFEGTSDSTTTGKRLGGIAR